MPTLLAHEKVIGAWYILLRNIRISCPNFKKKPTIWITLITLLSYQMMSSCNCTIVPLFFPILPVPCCQSLSPPVHVFPSNTSLSSGTYLHMFPRYLMYVSLFYYNSSYRARFLKGRFGANINPGLKFYSAIVFNFLHMKWDYHAGS